MATKISYREWTGGSGWNDPIYYVGVVEKSPLEVLELLAKTHDINHYKDLYRPVRYACSHSGLNIVETEEVPDMNIQELLENKYVKFSEHAEIFPKEVYEEGLEEARKFHIRNHVYFPLTDEQQAKKNERHERYKKQLEEVASVTLA